MIKPLRWTGLSFLSLALLAGGMQLGGCATAPATAAGRAELVATSEATRVGMFAADAGLEPFVTKAYAYVVFPSVGKGGLIAGGAYGRGVVYQDGKPVGYSDLTQATLGLQAGGQSFSELLVLEDKAAFDRFTTGKLSLTANASAVAIQSGTAAAAKYSDGVAVFVDPRGGLMVEAAIGGQQFTYQPN